jgi:hypothetical protein
MKKIPLFEEAEVKIGDKFKTKGGIIYEVTGISKNVGVVSYKATYPNGNVDERQGSIKELIKHERV